MGVDYVAIALVPKNGYDIEKWKQPRYLPTVNEEEGRQFWDNTLLIAFSSFRNLSVVGSTVQNNSPTEYYNWTGNNLMFDLIFKRYPICRIIILGDNDKRFNPWVNHLFPQLEGNNMWDIACCLYGEVDKNKLVNIEQEIEKEVTKNKNEITRDNLGITSDEFWKKRKQLIKQRTSDIEARYKALVNACIERIADCIDKFWEDCIEEIYKESNEENDNIIDEDDEHKFNNFNRYLINETRKEYIDLKQYMKECNIDARRKNCSTNYMQPLSAMCRYINPCEYFTMDLCDNNFWYRWYGSIITSTNNCPDNGNYKKLEFELDEFTQ